MKTPFIKYPSIENSYREKEINTWIGYHPKLMDEHYILQEKLHGSNIQFIFIPGLPVNFASRNRVLGDEDFHGLHQVLAREEYKHFVSRTQEISTELQLELRFYGELFGANIQKGVDYGKERRVLFFDLRMGDRWLPQEDFYNFMYDEFFHLVAPSFGLAPNLNEALEFDIEKDSLILNKEDNLIEGVVIKPYFKVFESPEGELFYLKKKNERFRENQKAPKEIKINLEAIPYAEAFREYINDNRLQGIFSKYGEIEKPNQIGDYIRYMIEDAKQDFLKDYDVSGFDAKDLKPIFNVGGLVMSMLKKYL